MQNISKKKCYHHGFREAAAMCPECGRFFCRECVTEHDDRVLCRDCLDILKPEKHARTFPFTFFSRFCLFLVSFFGVWMFFYFLGSLLIKIPSEFHEGTIWKSITQAVK